MISTAHIKYHTPVTDGITSSWQSHVSKFKKKYSTKRKRETTAAAAAKQHSNNNQKKAKTTRKPNNKFVTLSHLTALFQVSTKAFTVTAEQLRVSPLLSRQLAVPPCKQPKKQQQQPSVSPFASLQPELVLSDLLPRAHLLCQRIKSHDETSLVIIGAASCKLFKSAASSLLHNVTLTVAMSGVSDDRFIYDAQPTNGIAVKSTITAVQERLKDQERAELVIMDSALTPVAELVLSRLLQPDGDLWLVAAARWSDPMRLQQLLSKHFKSVQSTQSITDDHMMLLFSGYHGGDCAGDDGLRLCFLQFLARANDMRRRHANQCVPKEIMLTFDKELVRRKLQEIQRGAGITATPTTNQPPLTEAQREQYFLPPPGGFTVANNNNDCHTTCHIGLYISCFLQILSRREACIHWQEHTEVKMQSRLIQALEIALQVRGKEDYVLLLAYRPDTTAVCVVDCLVLPRNGVVTGCEQPERAKLTRQLNHALQEDDAFIIGAMGAFQLRSFDMQPRPRFRFVGFMSVEMVKDV